MTPFSQTKISNFEIATFLSPRQQVKKRVNFKAGIFLTEWIRSYIYIALGTYLTKKHSTSQTQTHEQFYLSLHFHNAR